MEKRKPTANDAADCIDMMLPRHATVYQIDRSETMP